MAYIYTTQEFDAIQKLYLEGISLEDIQAVYSNKSVASIRMKLVKAGVYTVKKTTSVPRATKAAVHEAYQAAVNAVGYAPW